MTLHGAEINEVARRQILGLCDAALIRAGVVGIVPTPLDTVSAAAGIADIIDIGRLPARLVETKPSALKRILGAYLFREKVVFVDRAQTSSRVRFTQAHETGHNLIPWHERSFALDDEEGLFRGTRDTLEAEASLAGAHLIFQGMRFFERALDVEVSVKAPMLLAPAYGASLHATIRYYAEHHPDPVATVITGRYPAPNGSLPIWTCVEAPAFRARFGHLRTQFTFDRLPGPAQHVLGILAHEALTAESVVARDVLVRDRTGRCHPFVAESFFNSYCVFTLLYPHRLIRLGRRLRLQAG